LSGLDATRHSDAVSAVPVEYERGAVALERAQPRVRRPAAPRFSIPRDSVYRRALGLADVIAATASLAVLNVIGHTTLAPASLLTLPLALLLSKLIGLYDREDHVLWSNTLDEAPAVVAIALVYTVAIWLAAGSLMPGHVHKGQFVLAWTTMVLGMLGGRLVARLTARALTERERCLVLGAPTSFERVRRRLKFGEHGAGEVVLGIPVEPGGFSALIDNGTLREIVEAYAIQRVVIVSSGHNTDGILELIREAGGLNLKVSVLPRFWETLGSLVVDEMPGTAMLAVRRFGLSRSSQLVKRSFDVAVAGVALFLLLPLMVILALLVRLTSPGPVLFRQERVGRYGRTFQMIKFRTMVEDADARKDELSAFNEAEGLFKIRDDPRVTRVGRRLRRTNLDELPQLINVLSGQMSLVGPRPLVLDEDAAIVGWRRRRLDVPPGMTGHWQVLGGPRVPLEEMVVIDYLYIANWSLWRDVKCLLRTGASVLAPRGL
jgi:exopolysaccharide biosynthesis polyprenyl glycosylphosphotransferase